MSTRKVSGRVNFNQEYEKHFRTRRKMFITLATKRLSNNPSAAEEAVQEAYTRAWQYRDKFNPRIKKFDAWFRTIFNNVVRDVAKVERSYGAIEGDVSIDDTSIESGHKMLAITILSYRCSKRDKEVIRLRYIDGMSIKDIPNFVDVSYDNARKICNLFKKSLEDMK